MPIYKYKCEKCGEVRTVLQSRGDPPPKHCKVAMVKQVAASSFKLKGTGWYRDNYD